MVIRRTWIGYLLCTLLVIGCGPEDVVLEEATVNAKVDSLVGLRMEEAARRSAEDLDRRQAIEVKVKTDSILNARRQTATPVVPQPAPGSEP